MANLLRKGDRTESAVPTTSTRSAPSLTAAAAAAAAIHSSKKSVDPAFNPWDVAQTWVQSVAKEESTRKQWEQMYGWMADFDAKGNIKPRRCITASSSRFSNTIPNSRGPDYGWHLETQLGQQIKDLQKRFDNQYKKHRSTVVLGYE